MRSIAPALREHALGLPAARGDRGCLARHLSTLRRGARQRAVGIRNRALGIAQASRASRRVPPSLQLAVSASMRLRSAFRSSSRRAGPRRPTGERKKKGALQALTLPLRRDRGDALRQLGWIAEVVVLERLQRSSSSYTSGMPVGMLTPTMSSSDTPSRYLMSARSSCRARDEHALAARIAGAIVLVPVRHHARHRVLQAFGERGTSDAGVPRSLCPRTFRVAEKAAAAACRSCAARRAPAPRRTSPPSRPCSGLAARRSGARSGASPSLRAATSGPSSSSAIHSVRIARFSTEV